jgi:hypothetical protein
MSWFRKAQEAPVLVSHEQAEAEAWNWLGNKAGVDPREIEPLRGTVTGAYAYATSTVGVMGCFGMLPFIIGGGNFLQGALEKRCDYCGTKRGFDDGRCKSCGAPEP